MLGCIRPWMADALALEVAEVLRVGRDLDRDELVGPDVVVRPPDFAERSRGDAVLQDVFADALVSWHRYSRLNARIGDAAR